MLSLSKLVLVAISVHQVFGLSVGKSVRCGNGQAVYRFMGGSLIRGYPDRAVANSYDPDWETTTVTINCSNYNIETPLPLNPALGLKLYQAVTCSVHDPQGYEPGYAVYMLAGRRWLPNRTIANMCIPNWQTVKPGINCGPLYHAEDVDDKCQYYTGNPYDLTGTSVVLRYFP